MCAHVFQDVLAALIRLANARYLSLTACAAGLLGNQCSAGNGALTAVNLVGCALAVPDGGPGPDAAALNTLLAATTTCEAVCSAGIANFIVTAGCCAATAAAAQAEWLSAIGSNIWLGRHFTAQWPSGRIEEFFAPEPICHADEVAGVACRAEMCGLQWPAVCCDDFLCANGGQKEYPSACFCSCPSGWIGANCSSHAPHVLAALFVAGLTRAAFEIRASGPLLAEIAAATVAPAAPASQLATLRTELDSAREVASERRQTGDGDATATGGLDLVVRVILPASAVGQDALQAAMQLQQSVESGLLGTRVATTGLGSAVTFLHTPEAYDALGNRVCDPVLLPCSGGALSAATATASNSTYNSGSNKAGGPAVTAAAAAAGATSMIFGVAVLEYRRRRRRRQQLSLNDCKDCSDSSNDKENAADLSVFRKSRPRQRSRATSSQSKALSSELVFAGWPKAAGGTTAETLQSDALSAAAATSAWQRAVTLDKEHVLAYWTPKGQSMGMLSGLPQSAPTTLSHPYTTGSALKTTVGLQLNIAPASEVAWRFAAAASSASAMAATIVAADAEAGAAKVAAAKEAVENPVFPTVSASVATPRLLPFMQQRLSGGGSTLQQPIPALTPRPSSPFQPLHLRLSSALDTDGHNATKQTSQLLGPLTPRASLQSILAERSGSSCMGTAAFRLPATQSFD